VIRPIQTASPTSTSLLPALDIPRGPKTGNVFELMPPGTEELLNAKPASVSGHLSDDPVARGGEAVRYGVPDKHVLSDKHTIDQDAAPQDPLREAFRDFVGQTLFGQMMSSMRSTVGKPAYFHGGRAEEIFSEQLDRVMVEQITEASASTVADPMFEIFNLQRSQ
jgi:peptidoglycan hydrolase FlgJ